MIIYQPWGLDTGLGGSSKQALDAARQLAKDAGFGGIYFIANAGEVSVLVNDGYDALTAYGAGALSPPPDESPYSLAVSGVANDWDYYIAASPVPFLMSAFAWFG